MNVVAWYFVVAALYALLCHKLAPANRFIMVIRFLVWPLHLAGFLAWRYVPRTSPPVSCENVGHKQIGDDSGHYSCERCGAKRSRKPVGGRYQWYK